MNGRLARSLRGLAGFNPNNAREYGQTVHANSITACTKEQAQMEHLNGRAILTEQQAKALGYSGPSADFFSAKKGPLVLSKDSPRRLYNELKEGTKGA